jgi:hypothetical protein
MEPRRTGVAAARALGAAPRTCSLVYASPEGGGLAAAASLLVYGVVVPPGAGRGRSRLARCKTTERAVCVWGGAHLRLCKVDKVEVVWTTCRWMGTSRQLETAGAEAQLWRRGVVARSSVMGLLLSLSLSLSLCVCVCVCVCVALAGRDVPAPSSISQPEPAD